MLMPLGVGRELWHFGRTEDADTLFALRSGGDTLERLFMAWVDHVEFDISMLTHFLKRIDMHLYTFISLLWAAPIKSVIWQKGVHLLPDAQLQSFAQVFTYLSERVSNICFKTVEVDFGTPPHSGRAYYPDLNKMVSKLHNFGCNDAVISSGIALLNTDYTSFIEFLRDKPRAIPVLMTIPKGTEQQVATTKLVKLYKSWLQNASTEMPDTDTSSEEDSE